MPLNKETKPNQGLRGIPTLPMTALTENFKADAATNVHPLPVSRYFISGLLWYHLCSDYIYYNCVGCH